MRKVIYMPRRSGTGQFNIELDPSGGTYRDWAVAGIDTYGRPEQLIPFAYPLLGAGGGRTNFVNFSTSGTTCYVDTTLEVFPQWNAIENIINAKANGANFASYGAECLGSPFSINSNQQNEWNISKEYYPSIDAVARQDVIACFNNVMTEDPNDPYNYVYKNIAIQVSASHFSTTYGFARDRRFFTTGAFGGGYPNDITVNYWETLFNVLSDTLNNYTNGLTPKPITQTTADSRLTFFSSLSSVTNSVIVNGINYVFRNAPQTIEGAGYDTNDFDDVINV